MSEQIQGTNEAQVIAEKVTGTWNKIQKPLLLGLAGIAVAVGGWWAYQEYVQKPKEEKAAETLFMAERFFAQDSSRLVLDGNGTAKGALYVINNYAGTKAANLAHYYAGVSYLKLGEFENAVKHLKDFSTDAKQIQLLALGCLGDAYAELNKKTEAIDAYKKAAKAFESDENNASEYLFRAALLAETNGQTQEALELFKSIKSAYPKTDKGFQADKYIYRLSIEPNELSSK